MTRHLFDLAEFASRLGLRRDTIKKYRLPPPDATYGRRSYPLWTADTIDAWDDSRPGQRRVPRPAPRKGPPQ